jgi:hypothetical protein
MYINTDRHFTKVQVFSIQIKLLIETKPTRFKVRIPVLVEVFLLRSYKVFSMYPTKENQLILTVLKLMIQCFIIFIIFTINIFVFVERIHYSNR